MERDTCTVLRRANGETFWFTCRGNVVYCEETPVASAGDGPFAVSAGPNGMIYLFTREHLCRSNTGKQWEKRRLPHPWSVGQVFFTWEDCGPALFYTEAAEQGWKLVFSNMGQDRQPTVLAEGLPSAQFLVQRLSPRYFLVCWQEVSRIAGRELLLSPPTLGQTRTLAETGGPVLDLTLAATDNELYLASLSPARTGVRLDCHCLSNTASPTPLSVHTCREAADLVLFSNQGRLSLYWREAAQSFYSVLSPDGQNFSRPLPFPGDPTGLSRVAFLDRSASPLFSPHALVDPRVPELLLAGSTAMSQNFL